MFKIHEIREIIRLIDQSSINEFVYENNGASISIKKSGGKEQQNIVQQETIIETKENISVEQATIAKEETPVHKEIPKEQEESDSVEENNGQFVEINSPMVGTFYRKPSPESDAYVEIGSKIEENSIVCIVEAMKLFNEIEAETTGEIVEILAQDGELVEYGQPLFKVKIN